MTTNWDIAATWAYHNATKHSYQSVRAAGHYLDWANFPLLFKIYPGLEPIRLPQRFEPVPMAALIAVSRVETPADKERVPRQRLLQCPPQGSP